MNSPPYRRVSRTASMEWHGRQPRPKGEIPHRQNPQQRRFPCVLQSMPLLVSELSDRTTPQSRPSWPTRQHARPSMRAHAQEQWMGIFDLPDHRNVHLGRPVSASSVMHQSIEHCFLRSRKSRRDRAERARQNPRHASTFEGGASLAADGK